MEVVLTLLVVAVILVPAFFLMKQEHRRELDELAHDCSQKIQQAHRDLVIVCTEPRSTAAYDIILKIKKENDV